MDTKECPDCEQEKPLEEFGNNSSRPDGKQVYCLECKRERNREWNEENREKKRSSDRRYHQNNPEKETGKNPEYHRQYSQKHYEENKEYYKEKAKKRDKKVKRKNTKKLIRYLKNNPCVDCGEDDPIVLEFDHVRGEKEISISKAIHNNWSWGSIAEEIKKCEVRCRNCHIRRTAENREFLMWEILNS